MYCLYIGFFVWLGRGAVTGKASYCLYVKIILGWRVDLSYTWFGVSSCGVSFDILEAVCVWWDHYETMQVDGAD